MKPISRRDMLKAGLLVPAVAAAAHGLGPISATAIQAAQKEPASLPIGEATDSAIPGAGRERLLLDFGWRFHFGNANDAAKDFGFGGGQ
jgi:beta-galactosidase